MKNKILSSLIQSVTRLASRLLDWLLTQPNTITYARPVKRDTHLNSVEAIHNWLETIDRPNTLKQGDTEAKGGGASGEKEE